MDGAPHDPAVLHGIELRYLLTSLMAGTPGRSWRVAELVARLRLDGFTIAEPASKTVSDLLRTEVARGRVVRVGWGRYRVGSIPGSTRRRIDGVARRRRELVSASVRRFT